MRLKPFAYLPFLLFSAFAIAQPGERKLIPKDTVTVRNGAVTQMTITYQGTDYKQVQRYRNGNKHGIQEIYSPQGGIAESIEYKDGFQHGEYITYDYTGQVYEKSRYEYNKKEKRSVLQGKKETFNNSTLISEYTYRNDVKNGPFALYDHKGKIQQQGTYKDNMLNGRTIFYYPDGKVKTEANYSIITDDKNKKTSVLHGAWKSYGPNGNLVEQGVYEKGKKSGLWREWNPATGLLSAETEYKNDKKHGAYKKYGADGTLQGNGILYEEIEINGQKLRNVQDGHVESFYSDGKMQSANDYKMGKPHGTWKYYAADGSLQSERHFKDGLETGTSVYYTKGVKSMETNFAIISKDGVATSVKHGTETNWKNKVLTGQTTFVNGVPQGTSKSFFDNGKPETIRIFNDGKLEGAYLYYHDNGQLRYRKTYGLRKQYDGSLKSEVTGWDEEFDREGRIIYKRFYGPKETILVNTQYADGVQQTYEVGRHLEISYFPDGKLMSVKILGAGTWPVAFYFYRNGSLRKMKFDDLGTLSSLTAEFNDKGSLLSVYNEQDSGKTVKADVSAYANAVNPKWANAPLFNDIEKNGNYKLEYNNGHTFLDISFKNGLPHGDFVVYEPVHGDTLNYMHFKDGLPGGHFVEKFAGVKVLNKGSYHANGEKAAHYRYNADGTPVYYQINDTLGHKIADAQYYPDGKMKSRSNNADDTRADYGADGLVLNENALVPGQNGVKVRREYYAGTTQLKRETFYGAKGDEGTDTGYHPNGKLQFKLYNKEHKREGPYVRYDENGALIAEGMYVNGEMQGEWITYKDGKPETDYYDKGKRQVGPPEKTCGCADTSIASNDIKFAPTVETLATYKTVQNYLPPYLIPADELNFKSLFYVNLQTSNGTDSGFASMKLLPLKPLAFYLPADKQVKITLTPCATKGYVSNMEVNSHYNFNDEEHSVTTLYPKRIMLELPGSPLKSNDPGYTDFAMLFDVDAVSLEMWKFKINTAKKPNTCYSSGIIKGFLNVNVTDAEPWLFEQNPYGFYYPEGRPQLTGEEISRNNELDNFFGIKVNSAAVSFTPTGTNATAKVNAQAKMYAGGKFVSGSIFLTCSENTATGVYSYTAEDGATLQFTQDDIKSQWAKKGFTRLQTQYNTDTNTLQLNFFAE